MYRPKVTKRDLNQHTVNSHWHIIGLFLFDGEGRDMVRGRLAKLKELRASGLPYLPRPVHSLRQPKDNKDVF
jgi:hypothetical protein